MRIGFIGAGKVGFSLGKYFVSKNISVTGFYSKTYDSSAQAAEFTDTSAYADLSGITEASDIIFITTPDDAVGSVWHELKKLNLAGKLICHVSGSLSSDIFKGIDLSGASGFSVHPMYAFSDRYNSYMNLNNAYFSIEGTSTRINEIKAFIETCGNKTFIISRDKKTLYHLSNVFASNMVLSLIGISCELMKECGLSEAQAFEAIKPLIRNNMENILNKGLTQSVTGPAERADEDTIIHHLEKVPERFEELYRTLTLNLLELCSIKNPQRDYSSIYELLTQNDKKRGE